MVQYANYAGLLTSLPTVEEILDDHASESGTTSSGIGTTCTGLCLAIMGDSRGELEKIGVAAVFHDLGIWANHTVGGERSAGREFPATMSTIGSKPNLKFVGNCTDSRSDSRFEGLR